MGGGSTFRMITVGSTPSAIAAEAANPARVRRTTIRDILNAHPRVWNTIGRSAHRRPKTIGASPNKSHVFSAGNVMGLVLTERCAKNSPTKDKRSPRKGYCDDIVLHQEFWYRLGGTCR